MIDLWGVFHQSHVEQTSPLFKREHEQLVHKASASCLRPSPASMQATAAFTVSLKPEGFVILAHSPTRLGLVGDFCPSARTFAVRLPPHNPLRDCTCFKLVVIIGWLIRHKIRRWFTHRGLSLHKFMPMPSVPRTWVECLRRPSSRPVLE